MTLHEFAKLTGAGARCVNEGYMILICPECEEYTWFSINTSCSILWLFWDDVEIECLDTVSECERKDYGADFKVWVKGDAVLALVQERKKDENND